MFTCFGRKKSPLAGLGLAALLAVAGCRASAPPSAASPLLGKPLPRLGRTLQGIDLDSRQLQGRVVVVKFFADYCKPCEKTLPRAQHLHEDHPNVVFIGVSLDERQSQLQQTVERFGLTFPVVHDRAHVVAGRFRVTELPMTFVVNVRGDVHWVGGPDQSQYDLEQALDSLL